MSRFYENIFKVERKKRDLRQEDIAKIIEISQSHYSKFERGEKELNFAQMERLCAIYGYQISIFRAEN